jgi:hypothetical protein
LGTFKIATANCNNEENRGKFFNKKAALNTNIKGTVLKKRKSKETCTHPLKYKFKRIGLWCPKLKALQGMVKKKHPGIHSRPKSLRPHHTKDIRSVS